MEKNNSKFVGYFRVSTEEQGNSKLSLDSQQVFVQKYVIENGGLLIGSFTDVESGKKIERRNLLEAIDLCVQENATLLVYDISRLSRGGYSAMAFLEERGVNFLEVTSPNDTSFIKDIKFSLAKEERQKISQRTEVALNMIKKNIEDNGYHISRSGNKITKLGRPDNFSNEGRAKGRETLKKRSREINKMAKAFIDTLRNNGLTYEAIANKLNESGFKTSKGKNFSKGQVYRLCNNY